jgi:hypothetical protein
LQRVTRHHDVGRNRIPAKTPNIRVARARPGGKQAVRSRASAGRPARLSQIASHASSAAECTISFTPDVAKVFVCYFGSTFRRECPTVEKVAEISCFTEKKFGKFKHFFRLIFWIEDFWKKRGLKKSSTTLCTAGGDY